MQPCNLDVDVKAMDDCDESFRKYVTELEKGNSDSLPDLYQNYQEKRNKLNAELFAKFDTRTLLIPGIANASGE